MEQNAHSCIKCVGGRFTCTLCDRSLIKYGRTKNGSQRYRCVLCRKTSVGYYRNRSYEISDVSIKALLKEGCGIRSIARLLKISNTTLLKRVLLIARKIIKPVILMNKCYEVDEMRTYYKNKGRLLWIVYALQKESNRVVDFAVGTRTKATLEKVISTLSLSNALKINTDKLNLYGYIIPASVHSIKQYGTNNIERKNLSIRTHLKRLNRRTICYTKSVAMLCACLKIYFWG